MTNPAELTQLENTLLEYFALSGFDENGVGRFGKHD